MTDRSYVICSVERNVGNSRIRRLQKRGSFHIDVKYTDPFLREDSLFSCGDGSFFSRYEGTFSGSTFNENAQIEKKIELVVANTYSFLYKILCIIDRTYIDIQFCG